MAPSSKEDMSSSNKLQASPPRASSSERRDELGANQLTASQNTFDPDRLNSNQGNFDPNSMLQWYLGNSTDPSAWNQMPESSGSFNTLAQSRTNWATSSDWGQTQAQAGAGMAGSQQMWALQPVVMDTSVYALTPGNQRQGNVYSPATQSVMQRPAPYIQQQSQLQYQNLQPVNQQLRPQSQHQQAVSQQYSPQFPEQPQQVYQQQLQNQLRQQERQEKWQQQQQLQSPLFLQQLQPQQAMLADENGQEGSVFSALQNNREWAEHVLQTFSFSSGGTRATLPFSLDPQSRGEYQVFRAGPLSPVTMYQSSVRQSVPADQIHSPAVKSNWWSEAQPAASPQTAHNQTASPPAGADIVDFAFASGKASNVFIAPQSVTIQLLSGYRPDGRGNEDNNEYVVNTVSKLPHHTVSSLIPRDTEVEERKQQDGHQHGERPSLPKSAPARLEQAQYTMDPNKTETIRSLFQLVFNRADVMSDFKSVPKQTSLATVDASVQTPYASQRKEQRKDTAPSDPPSDRSEASERTRTTAREPILQTYSAHTATENAPEDETPSTLRDDIMISNVGGKSLSSARRTETDEDSLPESTASSPAYVDFSRLNFMGQTLQQLLNWTGPILPGMDSSAKRNALRLRFGPPNQGGAADYTATAVGPNGGMSGDFQPYQSAAASANIQLPSLFAALGFAPIRQGVAGMSSPFAATIAGSGFAPVQQGMAGASNSPFATALTAGSTLLGPRLQFGAPVRQPAFATDLSNGFSAGHRSFVS